MLAGTVVFGVRILQWKAGHVIVSLVDPVGSAFFAKVADEDTLWSLEGLLDESHGNGRILTANVPPLPPAQGFKGLF